MTPLRTVVATAATCLGMLLLGGAGTASAQDTLPFAKKVPVTGEAKNGKQFSGTYTIKRFVSDDGQSVAVGTLKGRLKNRPVVRRGVRMPVEIVPAASTAQ